MFVLAPFSDAIKNKTFWCVAELFHTFLFAG